MGSSPRGYLYYGFPLGNEEDGYRFPWTKEEDDEQDYTGWQKVVLASRGIIEPVDDDERYSTDESFRKQCSEYWEAERQLAKEFKEKYGVEVTWAGYDGFESYYLAAFTFESEWGEMTPVSLEIQPVWEFKIKQFCEITGIPYQQPQWYLTSMYF